jgi:hypothetical protein
MKRSQGLARLETNGLNLPGKRGFCRLRTEALHMMGSCRSVCSDLAHFQSRALDQHRMQTEKKKYPTVGYFFVSRSLKRKLSDSHPRYIEQRDE